MSIKPWTDEEIRREKARFATLSLSHTVEAAIAEYRNKRIAMFHELLELRARERLRDTGADQTNT